MTKLKIALLFLSCVSRTLTETPSSEAQPKIDDFLKPPPDKTLLQSPPNEEPSFLSKVASWIYPFGGTNEKPDSIPAETQQRYAPQYLPAPQSGYPQQPCNPCNREPWIPVAGTHGHNTLIAFVQQSQLNNQGYLHGPNNLHNTHPPSPEQQYRPPPRLQYGSPPSSQYGPPLQQQQHGSSNIHFQHEVPKDQYGLHSNIKPNFGPAPSNYRIPLQYFVPPPPSKHGFPAKYLTPEFKHVDSAPPKFGPLIKAPKSGQSKFKLNTLSHHGPPIPLNFGKPYSEKHKLPSPPSLSVDFKPPTAGTYNLRNPIPPHSNYDSHIQLGQQNIDYILPSLPNYQLSLNNGQRPSQHQASSVLSSYDVPILPTASANIEQNIVGSGIHSPISSYSVSNVASLNKPIPFPGLSLSPVVPLHNAQPFQNSFSSSNYNTAPLHGSKVSIQKNNGESAKDIQIIPSIRVADYLASIEHPINVIQSPLVEVIATDNSQLKDLDTVSDYGINKVQLSQNPIVVEDAHAAATAQNASYKNPIQNQKRDNDKDETFNFENQNVYTNNQPPTFEVSNPSYNNQQLELATEKPAETFNLNYANNFQQLEFSQSSVEHNANQNNQNGYKTVANEYLFTQPPMDYSNWTPSFGTLSTSMIPPPLGEPVWASSTGTGQHITSTTKKPKQVQIIIPYTSNKLPSQLHANTDLIKEVTRESKLQQTNSFEATKIDSSSYLPLFTQPPTAEEPVWSQYLTDYSQEGSNRVTATISTEKSPTSVSNIKDLLLKEKRKTDNLKNLPFDIIRLQKNIDDWTHQEFSNTVLNAQKISTSGKLVPSKKIPSAYLTTQPYNKIQNEITTEGSFSGTFYDHEPAGSHTKISKVESNEDINANFILTESTPFLTTPTEALTTVTAEATTLTTIIDALVNTSITTANVTLPTSTIKPMWEKLQVSFSPLTKEKIYVVTPQPWKFIPKEINEKLLAITESSSVASTSAKFSVVIQPEGNKRPKDVNNGLHIVYSEWPHLINNLITTTTEKPTTAHHPLLGLMDLSSYTPPPNSTVETYGGHSRVITVVTPTSVTKKKSTRQDEKKATTKTVPTLNNH